MRLSLFAGLLALSITGTTLAHADETGDVPRRPAPQQRQAIAEEDPNYEYPTPEEEAPMPAPRRRRSCESDCGGGRVVYREERVIYTNPEFRPEQSYYCYQGRRCAPPVLPYPGPQMQPVPLPQPIRYQRCVIRDGGGYGMSMLVGVAPNGQTEILFNGPGINLKGMVHHYKQLGGCQNLPW